MYCKHYSGHYQQAHDIIPRRNQCEWYSPTCPSTCIPTPINLKLIMNGILLHVYPLYSYINFCILHVLLHQTFVLLHPEHNHGANSYHRDKLWVVYIFYIELVPMLKHMVNNQYHNHFLFDSDKSEPHTAVPHFSLSFKLVSLEWN